MIPKDVYTRKVDFGDRIRHLPTGTEFVCDNAVPGDVDGKVLFLVDDKMNMYDVYECEKIQD